MLEDALDVGEESHVEHPVGFIEHEHFEVVELGVGLLEMVEEAPWCRDDDVDAAAEGVFLRPHPDTTEHCRSSDGRVCGEVGEIGVDLRGELAGGGEDEGAGHAARFSHQPVDDGEEERGGFAAPGLGAREEVLSGHGGRDGVLLDLCGAGEAEVGDAAEEISVETEGGETHRQVYVRAVRWDNVGEKIRRILVMNQSCDPCIDHCFFFEPTGNTELIDSSRTIRQ